MIRLEVVLPQDCLGGFIALAGGKQTRGAPIMTALREGGGGGERISRNRGTGGDTIRP